MKERILSLLENAPKGMRKREISSALNTWVGNIITPICELEKDGMIYRHTIHDNANMEFYDIWFLKK